MTVTEIWRRGPVGGIIGFTLLSLLGVLCVPVSGHAKEPIRIGSLLPMTGALSAYGGPNLRGCRLAAMHLNEAGGVLGQEIEIVNRDSRTDPTSAVDAARKLVKVDGAPVIVGSISSGVTLAVAESVTIPNRVVQISPGSTSPQITVLNDNDFIYRTVVSDEYQGVILGQLALDRGHRSLSVMYVNNAYGKGLARSTADWFEHRGGTVQNLVPYEKGQPSYRGELRKATQGDPDVLVLVGYVENGSIILRQALSGGYARTFLLADGLKAPELVKNVGARYLEGTYGTTPGSTETPSLKTLNREYKKQYGKIPPKPFIGNSYDAVVVSALAMEMAGQTDSTSVRDHLREVSNPPGKEIYAGPEQLRKGLKRIRNGKEVNYEGAGGSVTFNKAGDVTSPILIWKIEGGEIQTERTVETRVEHGRVVPAKAAN